MIEYAECLMFLLTDYTSCLVFCLGEFTFCSGTHTQITSRHQYIVEIVYIFSAPLFIFGGTEMQFVTYTFLIRDRLEILNAILLNLSKRQCSMANQTNCMKLAKVSDSNLKAMAKTNREYSVRGSLNRQHTVILSLAAQPDQYATDVKQLQLIFNCLEKASINIASSFSLQIVVILIIKFTAFTSLLYFNMVILIRLVSSRAHERECIAIIECFRYIKCPNRT